MKKWRNLTVIALTFIMLSTLFYPIPSCKTSAAENSDGMRDVKAADIVADMGLGWNLGNTLDSHGGYSDVNTHFQLVGFYMDNTDKAWNMSKSATCTWKDKTTIKGNLSWDMSSIKSTDDSQVGMIGFQLWNFNKEVAANSNIAIKITKAEFTNAKLSVSFPNLLGEHSVTMKENGVAQFGITISNKELMKSSQLKDGTYNLSIEFSIPGTSNKSKEEYYETLWGNPLTTEGIFEQIKAGGFRAVRIPVTWNLHTDTDGNIDKAWMDRVDQIVNYALKNNLYCILNMHHDTGTVNSDGAGWLKADSKDPAMAKRYAYIWKQIAEHFKKYNDYLLFESFNEILALDSKGNAIWGDPGQTALTNVNDLNQLFVNTVRATGGNNAKRHLVVNTYAASTAQGVLDGFVLPNDTISNHLIVQVHDYTPIDFAWYDDDKSPRRVTWGTEADKANLDAIFNRLDKRFVSKGIPVIVGEFDSDNKNNTSERAKHAGYYVTAAAAKGIVCFWWDSGGYMEAQNEANYKGPALINRRTLKLVFPEILNALKNAAFHGKNSLSNMTISSISRQTYQNKPVCPIVTVKNGSELLSADKDYKITYSDNETPGMAKLMLTGCGDYYDTVEKTFLIVPSQVTISKLFNIKASSVTAKWDKVIGADGYQITYSNNKTGTFKVAGNTSAISYTVKGLKKGKTYYFKVKAYITINGTKEFGSDSQIKSIVVK